MRLCSGTEGMKEGGNGEKGVKYLESTFVFLQSSDLFEDRLQVHVEPVAVAEQLQEVA